MTYRERKELSKDSNHNLSQGEVGTLHHIHTFNYILS